MKMTVMPIVVGALGTVPKNLEKRLGEVDIRRKIYIIHDCRDQIEYSEESWRPEENSFLSDYSEKSPVTTGVKNSQ